MHLFWLHIDKSRPTPYIRQITEQIRALITTGEWPAGTRLPATRVIAAQLGVSRNIVIESYDLLIAEGYLQSQRGAGTYVADRIYELHVQLNEAKKCRESWREEEHGIGHGIGRTGRTEAMEGNSCHTGSMPQVPYDAEHDTERFPEYGQHFTVHPAHLLTEQSEHIDFRSGVPALDLFPRQRWQAAYKQACMEAPTMMFGYHTPEGTKRLRQAIADYVRRVRGVYCEPEHIILTNGATQAYGMLARLLLSEGARVIVEDPITRDIQRMMQHVGAQIVGVPVDEYGLITAHLSAAATLNEVTTTHERARSTRPSLIIVTPSHQFPLGGTLPIQRRLELLAYAEQQQCYVLEDDYDSEFRYDSSPISALQHLNPERVIYVGSFSKILSPALRIGYIVAPPALVSACRETKWYTDLHTATLEQLALARFIETGELDKHIHQMRKVYRKRRDTMVAALRLHFGEKLTVMGYSTGLHLVVELDEPCTPALLQQLYDAGVIVYPVAVHSIQTDQSHRIILGYGNVSEERIALGVAKLAHVLQSSKRVNAQERTLQSNHAEYD
ncbi:MocR-like pyridoxine biosynthesis transcription factor PdxR [Paenibacillus sp. 481]|uniref:MocR-like pyridoxine biosynthesis transcription factor PdxR n=1 Tax=Paenibacillus sp. 481 TaxID=2835869 RepID=UPI001E5CD40F|nr:PLP-dependent aminotransferase family protein [Paenibacillus sp. 481]UHA73247.1 PLP-dependent aminotransferase family protein [Paenibacillus sp. 481]